MSKGLTRSELLALPPAVDLALAARALNIGRSLAYDLAQRGEFPVRLLRLGRTYRVPTADLLAVLGLTAADTEPPPSPVQPRPASQPHS